MGLNKWKSKKYEGHSKVKKNIHRGWLSSDDERVTSKYEFFEKLNGVIQEVESTREQILLVI